MAMGSGNSSSTTRKAMADINVTPLVDVMLVLLIIFMVTAPLMTEGLQINVPKVKAKQLTAESERLEVVIDAKHQIFLNDHPFTVSGLENHLKANIKAQRDKEVYLRADKDVPYGYVVETMAAIKNAGIEKLGMITETPVDSR